MNLTQQQIQTIKGIVRVFETNRPADGYAVPSRAKGDRGVLSFGVIQFTLSGGSLSQLVQLYCRTASAKLADRFAPYLDQLEQKASSLRDDGGLGKALEEAANDPAMQYAQDFLEHNVYLKLAIAEAEKLGAKSALMVAICHDVIVHGWTTEWRKLAGEVERKYGTLAKLGEKRWIGRYLEERVKSLKASGGLLRKTLYRPQTFATLLEAENFDLKLPFEVHGQTLSADRLPIFHPAPTASGDGTGDLLFVCKYNMPPIRGENVRTVQQALQAKGYDVGGAGADGDYGNGTCNAVRQFQAAEGLPPHGAVDHETRLRLLGAAPAASAPAPGSSEMTDDPMAAYAFSGTAQPSGVSATPGTLASAPVQPWATNGERPLRPDTGRRQTNDHGLDTIIKYHTASPTPYRTQDQRFAIGFGHKTNVDPDLRISREEAYQFLYEDLDQVERVVEDAVGMDLTDNEFSALVSFAFDLEPKRFHMSPVVAELHQGGVAYALMELKKFIRYGGDMDEGLMRRRTEEAALFLTPDDQLPLSAEQNLIAETPEYRTENLSGATRQNTKKKKTLVKSRTMIGAGVGAIGAGGLIVGDPAEAPQEMQEAIGPWEGLPGLIETMKTWASGFEFSQEWAVTWLSAPEVRLGIALLISLSVALVLYARYDDWKNERR